MAITGVLARMEHKRLIERSIEALSALFDGITEAEMAGLQAVLVRVMGNRRRA